MPERFKILKEFKGRKTLLILEMIQEGIMHSADLALATLITPKGRQHNIEHKARLIKKARERYSWESQQKQKFNKLVYKLKREGLVQQKNSRWCLTKKGLEKILKLKERIFRTKNYSPKTCDEINIFAFDIPAKYKRYREWLRGVLKNLGFRMLQRSVWIGKIKIPQDFLDDLNKIGLLNHIEIVIVTKSGTLKNFDK